MNVSCHVADSFCVILVFVQHYLVIVHIFVLTWPWLVFEALFVLINKADELLLAFWGRHYAPKLCLVDGSCSVIRAWCWPVPFRYLPRLFYRRLSHTGRESFWLCNCKFFEVLALLEKCLLTTPLGCICEMNSRVVTKANCVKTGNHLLCV